MARVPWYIQGMTKPTEQRTGDYIFDGVVRVMPDIPGVYVARTDGTRDVMYYFLQTGQRGFAVYNHTAKPGEVPTHANGSSAMTVNLIPEPLIDGRIGFRAQVLHKAKGVQGDIHGEETILHQLAQQMIEQNLPAGSMPGDALGAEPTQLYVADLFMELQQDELEKRETVLLPDGRLMEATYYKGNASYARYDADKILIDRLYTVDNSVYYQAIGMEQDVLIPDAQNPVKENRSSALVANAGKVLQDLQVTLPEGEEIAKALDLGRQTADTVRRKAMTI